MKSIPFSADEIKARPFTIDERAIILAADAEIKDIKKAVRGALAALSQKATYQSDVNYAKRILYPLINGQEIDREVAEEFPCEKCGGECRYESRSGEPFRSFAICKDKECGHEIEF